MKILVGRSAKQLNISKLTPSDIIDILDDPNTSEKTLWELIHNNATWYMDMLPSAINITEEMLDYLANSPDFQVRRAVTCSPKVTSTILDTLADDYDLRVRMSVAGDIHTSIDTLNKLSTDIDGFVRLEVVHNPNTPINILYNICNDDSNNDIIKRAAVGRIAERGEIE